MSKVDVYPTTDSAPSEARIVTSTDIGTDKVGLDTTSRTSLTETSIIASSQSMASDFTSSGVDVREYTNGSIVLTWSGNDSNKPTAILEGSNNDSDYVEINGSGEQLNDASGTTGWEITQFDFAYYRLVYTANTATAGTFSAILYGKHI